MNKKLVAAVSAVAIFVTSCTSFNGLRQVASEPDVEAIAAQGRDYQFSGDQRARPFGNKEISKLASVANLKLIDGQLLKDNDAAFDRKLEMIKRATKEIRMVYFIYANDDSSSLINQALIEKAQSGVKVKLLVDFITNYKSLDLFQMLEAKGGGNIKTYFYNFPGGQIIQDANYMTLPCPESADPKSDTCYKAKMNTMNSIDKKSPTAFSKLFLSGLYGKNGTAIKVALGYGAQIDLSKYKDQNAGKSEKQLAEEKENLIDFVELVTDAFIHDSIWAKIKLSIAMVAYGDTLNPIVNEATGRLPIRSIEKNEDHGQLWDHLSDYTHHKLLAIDGEEFILGGRNIEDSYHMQERVGSSGKYIFIDTDFWGKTAQGGTTGIEASYDTILRTTMVADLARVQRVMPNDFIANSKRSNPAAPSVSEMAVGSCVQSKAADLGGCILSSLSKMPGYQSAGARVQAEVATMNASVDRYQRNYLNGGKKQNNKTFGQMSANDLQTAEVHYLENVNYKKDNLNQRIIGSKLGAEAKNNKNIQAAWYSALENVCRQSRKQKRDMEVVIHTAYLLMPSGMVHRIAKMMNNDYSNCSRVKIIFITNSPETTDLGPINLLARYQLGALFDHYAGLVQYEKDFNSGWWGRKVNKYKRFFPTMEYYEYKKTDGAGQSLHSKVSLIGDDLIIGSANADVRSYYMDTNNAIFIRNAAELNQQYRDYVKSLVSSGRIENKMNDFVGKSSQTLRAENEYMLQAGAKRWKQEARLTPERKESILNVLDKAGAKITMTTKKLLTFRGEFDFNNYTNENNYINKELNDIANDFDGTFKVF
ncbi:MAG: phospholipase D-like domain-containing protein [Pseudobdellovibrio sp.]